MTIRYYASETGIYLGAFNDNENGFAPPEGGVEVPSPAGINELWTGTRWAVPTRFYSDAEGAYLGAWDDPAQAPAGAIAHEDPPVHGSDRWNGSAWVADQTVAEAARRDGIIARILAVEAKQARAVREHALATPGAAERLQTLDAEIAAIRAELA